jgi:hypothetical protein
MKYILAWLSGGIIFLACKGLGVMGINVPEFIVGLLVGCISMAVIDFYEFYDKDIND